MVMTEFMNLLEFPLLCVCMCVFMCAKKKTYADLRLRILRKSCFQSWPLSDVWELLRKSPLP